MIGVTVPKNVYNTDKNAEAVQGVPNNAIRLRMMANPSQSIFGQIKMKRGCLEIDNNVPVPRIEGTNQELSFIWNMVF